MWDKLCCNEEQLHDVSAFISSSWWMGVLLSVRLSQDLGLTRASPIWNISDCHGREDNMVGCVPALKDFCLEVKYTESESAHIILAKSI